VFTIQRKPKLSSVSADNFDNSDIVIASSVFAEKNTLKSNQFYLSGYLYEYC
jgi:hypothetical protein